MNTIILSSAADAAAISGMSWRFIQDGRDYGIIGPDGAVLPVHYDEEGCQDGWEWQDADTA